MNTCEFCKGKNKTMIPGCFEGGGKFDSYLKEVLYNSGMVDQNGDSSIDKWYGLIQGRRGGWVIIEDTQGFLEVISFMDFGNAYQWFNDVTGYQDYD